MRRRLLLVGLFASGCGFHLRVEQPFAFQRLYLRGPESSPVVLDLRRVLAARKGLTLTASEKDAEATLQILTDAKEKIILSLTGTGQVREYQLRQRVTYSLGNAGRPESASQGDIVVTRTLLYSDTEILAKQSEETLLYRDMETDVVQQMMRRLAALKAPG
jgi:LPS-assembly lipoprotein